MIAIVSREQDSGGFPSVGGSDRILVKWYRTERGIRKFARQYAGNKAYRIEYFRGDVFDYSEAYKVEYSFTQSLAGRIEHLERRAPKRRD